MMATQMSMTRAIAPRSLALAPRNVLKSRVRGRIVNHRSVSRIATGFLVGWIDLDG